MSELLEVLMKRDGLTKRDAMIRINDAAELVMRGEDAEEVLAYEFGLEPDYIFDLLEFV